MFTLVIGTVLPLLVSLGSVAVVLAYRPRPPVAFIRPTAAAPQQTVLTPR